MVRRGQRGSPKRLFGGSSSNKAATTSTTMTFQMSDTVPVKPLNKRGGGSGNSNFSRHRRGGSGASSSGSGNNDEEGSLTYSAASSASVSTAGGESTDSSFADIMRVLDKEDSAQLEALMKKEGLNSKLYTKTASAAAAATNGRRGKRPSKTDVSVASSLNYSTDGDSAWNTNQTTDSSALGGSVLDGEKFLQTTPGQPSDSAYDAAKGRRQAQPEEGFDNSLFAEADPVAAKVVKSKRHGKKVVATKSSRSVCREKPPSSPSRSRSSRSSRKTKEVPMDERSDSSMGSMWYAKWMCGFAEAFEGFSNQR